MGKKRNRIIERTKEERRKMKRKIQSREKGRSCRKRGDCKENDGNNKVG